jgi:hypothetical protein
MRKLAKAVALAGAIGVGLVLSGGAQAAPASAAIGEVAHTLSPIDQVAVYVYGGRKHCWYRSGWHGAGWYWCGYAWRRGAGWGGPAGWNGWAAPGVVVVAPRPVVVAPRPVVVAPAGRYYWGGRHYAHRAWRHGRWVYY